MQNGVLLCDYDVFLNEIWDLIVSCVMPHINLICLCVVLCLVCICVYVHIPFMAIHKVFCEQSPSLSPSSWFYWFSDRLFSIVINDLKVS